jgi:septation ring formation regulator EzrA
VQPRSIEERLTMLERQMQEMRELPERVTKLESQIRQLRQVMRDEFSATRADLRGDISAAVTTLREAIAETNTHLRALHEGALSRIATIGEGRGARKKP